MLAIQRTNSKAGTNSVAEKLRMGVAGVGHFGKFHAAKAANSPRADLVAVADSDGERAGAVASVGALKEQVRVRNVFLRHVGILETIIETQPKRLSELLAEAFDVGQLAQVSSAAGAVARMGARFAAGDDALAGAVRTYQDAVEQWHASARGLSKRSVSRPISVTRRRKPGCGRSLRRSTGASATSTPGSGSRRNSSTPPATFCGPT